MFYLKVFLCQRFYSVKLYICIEYCHGDYTCRKRRCAEVCRERTKDGKSICTTRAVSNISLLKEPLFVQKLAGCSRLEMISLSFSMV